MKKSAIPILFIAILVGVAVGWIGHTLQSERDLRALLVARDLERVAFATNTLILQTHQPEKAADLQLRLLRSSLDNLEELTREQIDLPVKSPALRQGLERAAEIARSRNYAELETTASLVLKRLYGGAA